MSWDMLDEKEITKAGKKKDMRSCLAKCRVVVRCTLNMCVQAC